MGDLLGAFGEHMPAVDPSLLRNIIFLQKKAPSKTGIVKRRAASLCGLFTLGYRGPHSKVVTVKLYLVSDFSPT